MTRTASRTSLRGCGGIGRSTRGVVPRFAQVTVTGKLVNVEASADRGTSTWQVDTTVAVTISGAELDCARASAGAPASHAAARSLRRIAIILSSQAPIERVLQLTTR